MSWTTKACSLTERLLNARYASGNSEAICFSDFSFKIIQWKVYGIGYEFHGELVQQLPTIQNVREWSMSRKLNASQSESSNFEFDQRWSRVHGCSKISHWSNISSLGASILLQYG